MRAQSLGAIGDQKTQDAILLWEGTQTALHFVDSMLRGDTIASVWGTDDVQSLSNMCDIQNGYCEKHGEDVDEQGNCPDADPEATAITDEEAREVLSLADSEHDATIGINWDVLQCHLDYIRRT